MTMLVVDLSDPEAQKACGECQTGESKTFTNVTGTLVSKDDKTATFEVTDLEYADEAPADESAEGESPAVPDESVSAVKGPVKAAMKY